MEPDVRERFERIEANAERSSQLQIEIETAILALTQTVDKYVTAADTRMRLMESSINDLIRMIAAEHGDGHKREGQS